MKHITVTIENWFCELSAAGERSSKVRALVVWDFAKHELIRVCWVMDERGRCPEGLEDLGWSGLQNLIGAAVGANDFEVSRAA